MARFLLDENFSPKISHHLSQQHGLDAVPLRHLGRLGIPDDNVRDLALRHGRVLVIRDRDFTERSASQLPTRPGTIWVTLPHGFRTVIHYKQALDRFFEKEAHAFDLETSIIEVNDRNSILHHPRR